MKCIVYGLQCTNLGTVQRTGVIENIQNRAIQQVPDSLQLCRSRRAHNV